MEDYICSQLEESRIEFREEMRELRLYTKSQFSDMNSQFVEMNGKLDESIKLLPNWLRNDGIEPLDLVVFPSNQVIFNPVDDLLEINKSPDSDLNCEFSVTKQSWIDCEVHWAKNDGSTCEENSEQKEAAVVAFHVFDEMTEPIREALLEEHMYTKLYLPLDSTFDDVQLIEEQQIEEHDCSIFGEMYVQNGACNVFDKMSKPTPIDFQLEKEYYDTVVTGNVELNEIQEVFAEKPEPFFTIQQLFYIEYFNDITLFDPGGNILYAMSFSGGILPGLFGIAHCTCDNGLEGVYSGKIVMKKDADMVLEDIPQQYTSEIQEDNEPIQMLLRIPTGLNEGNVILGGNGATRTWYDETTSAVKIVSRKCIIEGDVTYGFIVFCDSEINYASTNLENFEKPESLTPNIERPIGHSKLRADYVMVNRLEKGVFNYELLKEDNLSLDAQFGLGMASSRVQTQSRAVFGEDRNMFDRVLNGLFCMVRNDVWKAYGFYLSYHLNLTLFVERIHLNFDPGGMWKNGHNKADGNACMKHNSSNGAWGGFVWFHFQTSKPSSNIFKGGLKPCPTMFEWSKTSMPNDLPCLGAYDVASLANDILLFNFDPGGERVYYLKNFVRELYGYLIGMFGHEKTYPVTLVMPLILSVMCAQVSQQFMFSTKADSITALLKGRDSLREMVDRVAIILFKKGIEMLSCCDAKLVLDNIEENLYIMPIWCADPSASISLSYSSQLGEQVHFYIIMSDSELSSFYVVLSMLVGVVWDPGKYAISFYIIVDNDVLKRKGIGIQLALAYSLVEGSFCTLLLITLSKLEIRNLYILMKLFVSSVGCDLIDPNGVKQDAECQKTLHIISLKGAASCVVDKVLESESNGVFASLKPFLAGVQYRNKAKEFVLAELGMVKVSYQVFDEMAELNCIEPFEKRNGNDDPIPLIDYVPRVFDPVTVTTPLYLNEACLVVRIENYEMPLSFANCFKVTFFLVGTKLQLDLVALKMAQMLYLIGYNGLENSCHTNSYATNAVVHTNAVQGAAMSKIFVWDPGVFHFTTLRTRRLSRGRICHVLGLKI